MDKQFQHISHKFIDSLSDGVFSIALTLLGLNVVELVPEISKSENVNTAIIENWPTFLSYLLGFVVLFSTWYQYHASSQYVEGTTAWIIWQHGLAMAWVALMPFGVILISLSLYFPWVALIGYSIFVASNVAPVRTLNRVKPMLEKLVTVSK